MDKIAVLVPCYNEAQTIKKVVEDFKRVLPQAVIYVYNNNSTDDTAKIAAEAGAIVRNEYKQGKGNVIRRMFREIDAECYIMTDGDDTYPAEFAPQMADMVLNKNCDMVVGDSINFLFKSKIKDIMTGFRAFSYQFVKTFPVLSTGFEIETEMTIHAVDKNMAVGNVVIDYRDRQEGSESKLNTFSDGFKVIKTIIRLFKAYKPIWFYGLVALILAIISIGFFIPILVIYGETGLVPKFPTLIMCCFVMTVAILSFFSGSILQSLRQKEKQDFELHLNQVYFNFMQLKNK